MGKFQSWANEQWAPLQRAASWNPPFYRFFGSEHSQVPAGVRPLSGDESCRNLVRLIDTLDGDHPRPHVFRRCLSGMWGTGYRPSPGHEETFGTLASKAVKVADPKEAVAALAQYSPVSPPVTPRNAAPAPRQSSPTEVTFDGQVWAVKKEFVIQSEMRGVADLLDPMNWEQLAPFFKQTQRIDVQKTDAETGSWQGILKETVAFTWNSMTTQSFEAYLKIDYTVTKERVRADYSLEYEEGNQLIVDDGFGEARQVDGGIHYIGLKRLRFVSSILNLVAPAALCMFIESDEDGFRDVLEHKANAIAPPVTAGAKPITSPPK